MMKCFCGTEAVFHVVIPSSKGYRFGSHPRCEPCKDRAVRSYEEVIVTELHKKPQQE